MINIIILYFLLINIRKIKPWRIKWAGYMPRMEGKPEGYRLRGRYTLIWESNIKANVKYMRHEAVDWTELTQNRVQWRAVVKKVTNHWVLYEGRRNVFTS
jgi:hypothetical protein